MIPWRLQNDLSLIAFEKTPSPLCQVLRYLAVDQGIGDLELEDHELAAQMHPVTGHRLSHVSFKQSDVLFVC